MQTPSGQTALHGAYLWRSINTVVELKKNWRAKKDPRYIALTTAGTTVTDYNGTIYADYTMKRTLQNIAKTDPQALHILRDALNAQLVRRFARQTNQTFHSYHSRDRHNGQDVRVRSSATDDSLGKLPLVPGMKVMITENAAISYVVYEEDAQGKRYAVWINAPGLGNDIYKSPHGVRFSVNRKQLPLLPAYAFTDFKVQGKSFSKVILDLSSARYLQNAYVMLSRASSLDGVAILRLFGSRVIHSDLSAEFRQEFSRLRELDELTRIRFEQRALVTPLAAGDDNFT
ncbi:hypothetical protein BJ138DRAFT_1134788 [Hygrophoropsis aurantiaca]|uniref:Uncharacterized protein n=1 Tax=Hygrophoropsis aurantiaca TaxID=72124 RepID=A0ACB8AGB8_9AGAM|nr:hypothetical protein BJ138DRAFT_1134788 [Hygrophoropsis aurantiaca]